MYKFKTLIIVVLCLAFLFSFTSCKKKIEADSTKYEISENVAAVSAEAESNDIYISDKDKKNMAEICRMDMLTLYFDKENYSVAVYDETADYLWRALPEEYNKEKTSVIALNILVDGVEYTLSSQSDSVAFSSSLYETAENGISVNYGFKRTLKDGRNININVPVLFSLKNGVFSVCVDCESLVGRDTDKDIILKSIEILPFFGSSSDGSEGDYILLPSGSGAILDTSESVKKFKEIKTTVYSEDNTARIGAFGMKKASSAFVCLIEKGEERATVSAAKALKTKGYNRVGAEFQITPTKKDENSVYVSDKSYNRKIELSYRFLSNESATYVSMASAVRELLIRNGSLTEGNIDTETEYPFNLSLLFKQGENVVTDFSKCYDMLSSLKSKGFNRINVFFSDIFKSDGFRVKKEFGDKNQFDNLVQFASVQNIGLYADIDLYKTEDDFAVSLKSESETVINADSFRKRLDKIILGFYESEFDGICISGAGEYLYGDYSKNAVSLKGELISETGKLCSSCSGFKALAVRGGNLYSVKYASNILSLEEDSELGSNKYCRSVPFLQSVLHGISEYSHTAINLSEDIIYSALKCAEYGAVPYFVWHYDDLSLEEEKDSLYYYNSLSYAQVLYERLKESFSDLRDSRITAHTEVKKDVFRTEFDNSSEIYVNYSDKAVSVNGVVIDSRSFIRVN